MMKRILAMLMCLTLIFSSSNVVFATDSIGYSGFYEETKAIYDYSRECGDDYVDDNVNIDVNDDVDDNINDDANNDTDDDVNDDTNDDVNDDTNDDADDDTNDDVNDDTNDDVNDDTNDDTDDDVNDNEHIYENGTCIHCGAAKWDTDGDGVLEILAIGNSFSTDALQYAYQIAQDLGIQEIVIGNLYIASCTLEMHAAYAANNLATYTYYYNDNGTWIGSKNYKISTALDSRSWDYVSLQEGSPVSGMESSYNENLTDLISYVQAHSDAKLVWHMTWAYQQNSTHSAFYYYNNDQMTMYNAIVAAVQNKIVTNGNFDVVVPNGTVVQNSRTSLLGDTTTRDGHHMSYDYGRYLTGLTFIKAVTGLSMDEITYRPNGVNGLEQKVAIESVNNAFISPFTVTKSSYDSMDSIEGYVELHMKLFKGAYWYPSNAKRYNELVYDTKKSRQCFATIRFTRDILPPDSIIILENGWKYRPNGWITDAVQTGREALTTQPYVAVTEEWWGDYTFRAFNISLVSGESVIDMTEEEMRSVFRIYVPEGFVHIFDQKVATDAYKATDIYKAAGASCIAKETYYYSCICGEKGRETFAYGDLSLHVYDQKVATDAYKATDASCTAKARSYYSCICGEKGRETFAYGDLLAHVYDKEVATDTYKATNATCTAKAAYYYSCVCGKKGTEMFESGKSAPHTWTPATTEAPKTCTECGKTEGEPLEVTSIRLDKTNLVISLGKTSTLKVEISPDDAGNRNLTWSTSNKKIVTVNKNGKVKGIKAGTAKITVTMKSGATATCKVTVKAPSVTLQKTRATIKVGKTTKIKFKSKFPASDSAASYKSSNKKIATVDRNGKVKGVKAGTATITVKMKSGATAKFKVIVK